MDAVMSYGQSFDAVIQAGYGEHGREGLQELLDVPVVDITEAAATAAMFLGHKYSVVTTLDRAVPLIEDRLKLAGLNDRCASVRASGMAVLGWRPNPSVRSKRLFARLALPSAKTMRKSFALAVEVWPNWMPRSANSPVCR